MIKTNPYPLSLQNNQDILQENVLSVHNLHIAARKENGLFFDLVKKLSFDVKRGETLAIAGESGSGKSITSLACMGLLPKPQLQITGGAITFEGMDLVHLSENAMQKLRGNRIAMIFQEPMTSLNPVMSIGRQMIEAILAHEAISHKDAAELALQALKKVRLSQPEKRLKQFPHELSGGMRQRVMIAMAIAMRPSLLIADEPTTALDVTIQREVLDLLRDLQQELGTSIILITHDMGVVAEMADRVIIMREGEMVEENTTLALFETPKQPYTQELLKAVPRIGSNNHRAKPKKNAKIIVRYDDVCVKFPVQHGILGRPKAHIHAVEHVSLDIYQGETISLVGESGCGKSTIARALVGLVPFSGDIVVQGKTLGVISAFERKSICAQMQMVFQDPMAALDARMTIGELIKEPLVIHKIGDAKSQKKEVLKLLERVEIPANAYNRYPHQFSGGQRQRICIARALALKPKLIICDESVAALDVSIQAKVLELLGDLQKEMDMSYLFISHDMAVVNNISDRVAVMYLGQIVELGTRDQIFNNPQHNYTKRLLAAVPIADPRIKNRAGERLTGEIPSPIWKTGESPKKVKLTDIGEGHKVSLE